MSAADHSTPEGGRCPATTGGGRYHCHLTEGHVGQHVGHHPFMSWTEDEPPTPAPEGGNTTTLGDTIARESTRTSAEGGTPERCVVCGMHPHYPNCPRSQQSLTNTVPKQPFATTTPTPAATGEETHQCPACYRQTLRHLPNGAQECSNFACSNFPYLTEQNRPLHNLRLFSLGRGGALSTDDAGRVLWMLGEARRQLAEAEERTALVKETYAGEMRKQAESHIAALTASQQEVARLREALADLREWALEATDKYCEAPDAITTGQAMLHLAGACEKYRALSSPHQSTGQGA